MSLKENWVLQADPGVYKTLAKVSRSDAGRVLAVIESLSDEPFAGDIQKLKGEKNTWRRRVGPFRIFYELIPSERVIHVFKLERRTSKMY